MKRIISLFLTVTMIASLIVTIPVTNVAAAETITDEALFMTYPTYLSNSEMDEGLQKAEAAYYAVINSYSDSDETVAALMSSMSEGVSILIKEGLANLGYGETLYETQAREAATKYMQSMLTNENVIKKASGIVDKAYKTLKTSYSIASNVDKTTMMADLVKVATENDISIKPDDIDDLVNDLYDAGSLKTDLAAIGEANKLWKIVFEFTEIHAIEKTTLDLLMDELSKSGQTGSDLYLGLSLLKKDMEKDSASYVLKYYATDKAVSYLADKVDDLIGAVTSTNAVSLVTTFMKVFADYIYVNAKAEDITQAIMQTSFVSSIDICLSQYRLKFLQGTGTTADMETYENLYGAYLAAHKATLDTCYDIAKITDKFSLGGDCMIWSSNIETLYTYDKYIEWCKEEIAHDISNKELDKTTGSSNITDALNEETIADRIERVLRLYPAGSKWAGDFGGTKSSLGYAGKVFNHIFDKTMSGKVENDYQYILTSNRNVRLIGRLEEKAVTEAALKELFANVRIGDVVITSGQYDYLHAMTIVGMGENGPIVYDVDSKYGPAQTAEEYTHLIQQYEFPYSKMADAFSSNGKYLTKPGISVYRAIKKVNTTNSGTSLYYEEYDDSVNYVIENDVLKAYNGSRTTIEIPDGVTSIAANCFKNNTSIKYVYMPDTITKIGDSAFYGCTNLRYVDLSSGLTTINSSTFYKCTMLGGIIIPDSVIKIEASAFDYCTNLSSVQLSKTLEKLGGNAFGHCDNLTEIEIPKSLTTADHGNSYYGYDSAYGPFSKGGLRNVTFEEGAIEVSTGLFVACPNIENVELPDSIVRIEGFAFSHNKNLKNIKLSSNITTIQEYAFYHCEALESVDIPDSVTSMGNSVFYGCNSLEKVKLPNLCQNIPASIFYNCSSLSEITLPKTLEEISGSAFYGCSKLNNLSLPDSLTTIGGSAFYENKALTEITIPENVTSIGSSAFQNCDALTKAEIKGSGTIGEKAFYDCDALTSITIGDKVTTLGKYMCYDCDKLTDIKLGKGITTIPDSAFRLCQSLETVTIPRFCTTIATNAFAENTKLKSAYIPASVTSIQSNSFSYPNIMSIYGKNDSYANEYADGRGFSFVAVDAPITTLAYPESNMNIARYATIAPDMQTEPSFDTDTITFTSGDTNIATVSASGAVYGKSYGRTTITMTTESGLSDSIEVTVVRPATSVTLNKEGLDLAAGNSEVLTATISPTNSTDVIKWSSDNAAVAVVDDSGKITAISKGTANITATAIYGNKSDTCLVTVVESNVPIVNVTGITLNSNEQEITIGKTYTLKANVLPADATNKLVEWTTSNSSVADVADGVVTAKSLGEATITAKTVSGGFVATCKVTVVPKIEITSFTAANYGPYTLINLSAVNAPATAKVYIASYDKLGKLLELQSPVLSNGTTSAIFQTANVFNYKAFIWKNNGRPLSEPKECILQ